MNNNVEFKINYANMRTIIINYFKSQGRDVKVTISSTIDTDRFKGTVDTIVTIYEKVIIAGVQTTTKKILWLEDLKEIINETLSQDNKELVDLTCDAYSYTSVEGAYMGEHGETKIGGKSFTAIIKEKQNVKTKVLK